MNSVSTAQRILSALTIAIVASSTVVLAADDEPFEVVTSKAVYVTREGVALNARPAFEIQARSFPSMMTDARSQLLAREITLTVGPRESVMRPLRFGERSIEIQVSEPERISLLGKIPPSFAATTAGLVTPLLVSHPALLAITYTAIELTDLTEPLEEIVNAQHDRDQLASLPGRYALVDERGRVIPSAGSLVQRLPDSGVKDFATYVVRHVRQTDSQSVLGGWLASLAAKLSFRHFFRPGVSAKEILTAEIQGWFVGSTVDLTVRDATSASSGGSISAGGGCYTMPPLPGMIFSMPILCNQSLTPSLQVPAPVPLVSASAQAVPFEIRAVVPEVNIWFDRGTTALRTIPVAPSTYTVVPDEKFSPSSGPRDQSLRGLPTGVHLKGDFGGFTLDRHR